ncbi:MAG: hypothetical protein E7679_04845 [Ruminococcaceae bacterium]|nr:hypothetical protein [Oscillospiraceae bacterium]
MKKILIIFALLAVSALLLGVFAGGAGFLQGVTGMKVPEKVVYRYTASGDINATEKCFGTFPVRYNEAKGFWEVSNLNTSIIVLCELDPTHNSIKVFDADTSNDNTADVCYEESFEVKDKTYKAVKVSGHYVSGIKGPANVIGVVAEWSDTTKLEEFYVTGTDIYGDSGYKKYPYVTQLDVTAETYYAVFFHSTDGKDIDLEGLGLNGAYYISPKGTDRYAIVASDTDKLTFVLNSYNCKIEVYRMENISMAETPPEVIEPSGEEETTSTTEETAEQSYMCSECEYESSEMLNRCPYCSLNGTFVPKEAD